VLQGCTIVQPATRATALPNTIIAAWKTEHPDGVERLRTDKGDPGFSVDREVSTQGIDRWLREALEGEDAGFGVITISIPTLCYLQCP